MIQSIIVPENGKVKNITSAQLSDVKNKTFVWIDVEDPTEEDFEFLRKNFPLHPLASDPVFESRLRPKIIDFQQHLLLVFHEPLMEQGKLSFSRAIFFIGKDFLITVHNQSLPSIDAIKELVNSSPKVLKKGSSFLVYDLLDQIVDNYFPILDELDDEIDNLESKMFLRDGKDTLRKVFSLKRKILELKRKISPVREVLSALSRHESKIIDKNALIYFRDVYDHAIRISDTIDIYRDLLTSILEVHISLQSNKLNEVMKVLTVIATIMMPLTLITGFYGMNIVFPEVELFNADSYFFILFLMLIVSGMLIMYFRKKKWL
ncbi:MAG: magnesium and cobalt transport protein CorA [Candidatus Diapherotrites archaeon]|uniref:Magnesium transport protein CorA n=1 Tax=Candidatus Iainarchaeum sp. TaxID=3101447 RepID=A0A2D6LQ23_9ARCH|nr:magnesium and cobalt transport protein CorA [Candidatus Diapherotrites archaeon]